MPNVTPVEKALVFILVLLILLAGGKNLVQTQASPAPSEPIFTVTAPNTSRPTVTVYLTGAVKNPGVYTIKEGSRVIDLLEKAGGGLPDADWEAINLAAVLHDQERVYLPSKSSPSEKVNPPYVKQEKRSSATYSAAGTKKSDITGKVNINEATLQELIALPGIGEKTARKIIEYRQEHGPFNSPEDLKKVKGIGEKSYQKLADRITL